MKNKVAIPEPFNKYYKVVSAEQIVKAMGWDSLKDYQEGCDDHNSKHQIYGVEDNSSYDMEHVAWLLVRSRYAEKLSDTDYTFLELAKDGDQLILAYECGGRIYDASSELADILDVPLD